MFSGSIESMSMRNMEQERNPKSPAAQETARSIVVYSGLCWSHSYTRYSAGSRVDIPSYIDFALPKQGIDLYLQRDSSRMCASECRICASKCRIRYM